MKKKILTLPRHFFLSGILLFSGCGSSATTSAVHQNKSADSWAVEASEPLDDSGFSYDGEADMMDDTATAETAGSSSDSSVSDAATDAAEATHDQSTRKLIRTVSMDIATEDLDTLRTKLDNSITSCGGYIESSTLDTPQNGYSRRSYYVTARIPSDNLDSFLETAGTLGTVTNKNIETEDITLRYVDQKAYLDSLRTEYDRVSKLLEQATELDQILALESKLSDLRYQINSYETQLRTYDNLVDYSTVYLNVNEVAYEQPTSNTIGSRISNGFRNSLYEVRDFFVDLFVAIIANLPVLVVLIAIITAAILLIRKLIRRHKAKKGNTTTPVTHPPIVPADTRFKQRCKNNIRNRKQVIPDSSAQKLLPPIKSQRRSLIEHRWQLFYTFSYSFFIIPYITYQTFSIRMPKIFHSDFLSSRLKRTAAGTCSMGSGQHFVGA